MIIRRRSKIEQNIYHVYIDVIEPTAKELESFERWGEPIVNMGGNFNTYNIPNYYRKLYSQAPHHFFSTSQVEAEAWQDAKEAVIVQALEDYLTHPETFIEEYLLGKGDVGPQGPQGPAGANGILSGVQELVLTYTAVPDVSSTINFLGETYYFDSGLTLIYPEIYVDLDTALTIPDFLTNFTNAINTSSLMVSAENNGVDTITITTLEAYQTLLPVIYAWGNNGPVSNTPPRFSFIEGMPPSGGGGTATDVEEYEEEVMMIISPDKANIGVALPELARYKTSSMYSGDEWAPFKYKYFYFEAAEDPQPIDTTNFVRIQNASEFETAITNACQTSYVRVRIFDKVNKSNPIRNIKFRNELFNRIHGEDISNSFKGYFGTTLIQSVFEAFKTFNNTFQISDIDYAPERIEADSTIFFIQKFNRNFDIIPGITSPYNDAKGNVLQRFSGDGSWSVVSRNSIVLKSDLRWLFVMKMEGTNVSYIEKSLLKNKDFSSPLIFLYPLIDDSRSADKSISFNMGPVNFHQFLIDKDFIDQANERLELKIEYYGNSKPKYSLIDYTEHGNFYLYDIFKTGGNFNLFNVLDRGKTKFPKSIKFAIRNMTNDTRTKWYNLFKVQNNSLKLFKIRFLPDRI